MEHIVKTFPGVMALRDVSLDVRSGGVHAICGENGAGKSTLMKVLSGAHPAGAHEGQIHFEGELCEFKTTRDSGKVGIVIIHQESALSPRLSIAEIIFLGNEQSRGGVIDFGEETEAAERYRNELAIKTPNIEALVGKLIGGDRQKVALAKWIHADPDVLVLDEQNAYVMILAIGMVMGIVAGHIDLSVGSFVAFVGVTVSPLPDAFTTISNGSIPNAFGFLGRVDVMTIAIGALIMGVFNGACPSWRSTPPDSRPLGASCCCSPSLSTCSASDAPPDARGVARRPGTPAPGRSRVSGAWRTTPPLALARTLADDAAHLSDRRHRP